MKNNFTMKFIIWKLINRQSQEYNDLPVFQGGVKQLDLVLNKQLDRNGQLYQLAEQEIHNATDYYQFTRLIAKHYSQQQKIQVIELLWRIAYADNHLDAYEEHMVRRIADLIYVPHQDFIQAKLRVQNYNSSTVRSRITPP